MFRIGQTICVLCRTRIAARDVLRGRVSKGVIVCRSCFEEWERAGRRCVACDTPVHGGQDTGVFMHRPGFGHADCGAVWLTVGR